MRPHFHLPASHPSICFHVDRTLKERQKLAEDRLELKARIAKGERRLTIQGLKVVKTQRPYLWHVPLVIHVPPSIPVGDKLLPSWPSLCSVPVPFSAKPEELADLAQQKNLETIGVT